MSSNKTVIRGCQQELLEDLNAYEEAKAASESEEQEQDNG